jgi:hypothetical protein
MGFKSKQLPAEVVFQASGENCLRYEQKQPGDGSIS